MSIEWFIHIANVMYLISYLVKDIFILRFITVIATLTLVPFYLFQGNDPLWAPIIWAGVFTIVNVYQIYLLFKERRPVFLEPEDDKIYQQGFTSFTLKQFEKLLSFSKKEEIESEECLINEGSNVDRIIFITQGGAKVMKGDRSIMELETGDLIGEVNYITDSPSQYRICAMPNSKIIYWSKEEFDRTLEKDPSINSSWQSLISNRLAHKLSRDL